MRTVAALLSCLVLLLSTASSAAAQATAFVGGRLIDGTGRVIDAGTVVIDGGRIVAAGPAASTPVPAGATRLDVTGKTLVPGLINAHGHVAATTGLRSDPASYTRENLTRQLKTYAQYGVTTVFSLGDDQALGFEMRNEQAAGPLDRAKLFVGGSVITGNTADEARAMAIKVADMKPDLLKIRVDDNLGTSRKMPEAAWRAVIDEAHARKLKVAVHIYSLADAKATLAGGADFIAHSVRDVPVDAAFIAAMKARDVCYSPTFTREISTFIYDSTPAWIDDPFFVKGVTPEIVAQLKDPKRHEQVRNSAGWKAGQQYKAGLEVAKRNLKALVDGGVRIAFGTDSGPPARFQGFFEHLELEMMVEAGLTPMQALVSATGDAARCHQRDGQFGTLAAGAAADLVVLGANPLDNIRNTRSIEQVWINGRRAF
ncbi:MAG: amidohydrolase family protein [Acidobacteriota bacterium]|nr:amidohydrolase family protein [Acidobacteriota bacterium]